MPWRSRWATELGGPIVNLAIHAHDLVSYVLGPVASVSARLTTLVNPIETEDCAPIWLEMADGSLVTLSVTTGSAHEISRQRFCFANLSAESNTAPYRSSHDPWTFTGDTPEVDARIGDTLATSSPGPRIRRPVLPLPPGPRLGLGASGHPGRRAGLAELITAICRSARTGSPVGLPRLNAAPPALWRLATTRAALTPARGPREKHR